MPSDALLAKMREVEEWRQKNKLLEFEFEIVRADVEAKQKATREMQQRVAEMRGQNAAIHSSVEKIQATAEESPTTSVLFIVLEKKLAASHAAALARLETLRECAEQTEEIRAKFEEEKSRCEWLHELEEVEAEHEAATAQLAETKRELEQTTANCEEAERLLNERKEFELQPFLIEMCREAVEAKKLRQKLAQLLVLNKKLRAQKKKGGSVDEEDEEVEEPPVLQEDDQEEEVAPAAPEEEIEVVEQPLEAPTHQPRDQPPAEPLDDPLEILIDEPEKEEPEEDDEIQVIDVIERPPSPSPPLIGEEQPEEGDEEETADGGFLGFNLFDDQPDGDEADGEQEAEAGDENDAFFTSQLSTASSGVHGFNVDRCSPPAKKKPHERKAFGQARQSENTGDDSSPLAFELVADESGSPTGFDFGAESNGTRSSAGSFNFNFGFEDGEPLEENETAGFNFSFDQHDE